MEISRCNIPCFIRGMPPGCLELYIHAWLHCRPILLSEIYHDLFITHSVGLYMKIEKSRNPSFSFKDYLKLIERVPKVQEESEKMLQIAQQSVYPYTTEVATTMAVEQMAKDDPNLYKVGGCSSMT